MNVVVVNAPAIGEHGAALIRERAHQGTVSVLGVATGSSPTPIYKALASALPFGIDRLALFGLDEYVGLPAGHFQSYESVVQREIAEPLGVDPSRVRVLDAHAPDLAAECAQFEDAIRQAGGVDLQILGLGRNGHIGFNEPGTDRSSRTRIARLAETTRRDNARFFGSPEEVPTRCLTQGIGTILEARQILVVARGRSKAPAVRRALEEPPGADSPASWLQDHPSVTFLLDATAASMLSI